MQRNTITANGSELRRRILDISRNMLVTEGFNNITMRKIAKIAGCSATSIYLYFKNKDDLLHTLIDEGFELLYKQLVAARGQGNPLEQLKRICHCFVDFGISNPEYYEIMFLIHPDQMKRYPADKFRRAKRPINLLQEILEEGKQQGVVDADDTFTEAFVAWSAVHGAITAVLAKRVDVSIPTSEFLNAAVNRIWNRYLIV